MSKVISKKEPDSLFRRSVAEPDPLLRRSVVEIITGLSRSSIYAQMAEKTFPRPVQIGTRSVAWRSSVDMSRFDAAPLIAFTATKETDYGTETDKRIPPGCGAYRTDQRAYTQAGC